MAMVRTIVLSAFVLVLILLLIALMVLPAIIAFRRRHPYKWPILALTIVGGWTMILWIAALVWALVPTRLAEATPEREEVERAQDPENAAPPAALVYQSRRVSPRLTAGIVLLPFVFSWFTLRRGYSTATRAVSIGYAILCIAVTAMCVVSMDEFLAGLSGRAAQSRADAKYAVDNRLFMVTTPEELVAALDAGRDDDLRRRVLLMDGTISSMRPNSGHTDIVLRGYQGVEVKMNGDYLVGLKPGDEVTAGCSMIMHIATVIILPRCMVAPKGQMPLPSGADIQYGIKPTGSVHEAPAGSAPAANEVKAPAPEQTARPAASDAQSDAFGETTVSNPFK